MDLLILLVQRRRTLIGCRNRRPHGDSQDPTGTG
jgi:hypothetical protein